MHSFREFLKSGHAPTLWSAFLYFGFSCAIWVINGAMAPFIREAFQLTPTQMGMMLSIPIFAGALMRFPLGILAQYIGRKNATLVEMAGIFLAMGYGYLFVHTYNDLLAMGVLLGVAGASFGVALSLGSGSFPPRYKGLAMGIVGAGNVAARAPASSGPVTKSSHGLRSGQSVFHTKFGEGVIVTLEGTGEDARAQVNFGRHGMKWLALSVAKLTPIE